MSWSVIETARGEMDRVMQQQGYASEAYQRARVNFHHAGRVPTCFEAWTVWQATHRALGMLHRHARNSLGFTELSWPDFVRALVHEGRATLPVTAHGFRYVYEVCAWAGEEGLELEAFEGPAQQPADRFTELLRFQYHGPGMPAADVR